MVLEGRPRKARLPVVGLARSRIPSGSRNQSLLPGVSLRATPRLSSVILSRSKGGPTSLRLSLLSLPMRGGQG